MSVPINENYKNLGGSYLFSEIARRVAKFASARGEPPISLGVGDVTLPLPACVVDSMTSAVKEMGRAETFRGYPPYFGYDFLRDAIRRRYGRFGVSLDIDEIFVSDGAKSDAANFAEVFGDAAVFAADPVYPVFRDSGIMAGRRVFLLGSTRENGFLPLPTDDVLPDSLIYLCSPNNPTGAVYDENGLCKWIDFAKNNGCIILFDAAYEAYIDGGEPHSIYQINGACECAVEICSFSKTAGFTGLRCSWTVVPKALVSRGVSINEMWARRQSTKFNGVSYIIQRGAEASLSEEGARECGKNVSYYKENVRAISEMLDRHGIFHTRGASSPYVWFSCPRGMSSWEFFDAALDGAGVVGTPGAGFGKAGEGYFRLTGFNSREMTLEAISRLEKVID